MDPNKSLECKQRRKGKVVLVGSSPLCDPNGKMHPDVLGARISKAYLFQWGRIVGKAPSRDLVSWNPSQQ